MKSYFVVKGQKIDPDFAVLMGEIDGDQVFEFDWDESAEFFGIAERLRKLKDNSGNTLVKSALCFGSETISIHIDENAMSEDDTISTYEEHKYKIVVSCPTFPIKIGKFHTSNSSYFEIKNMRSDNKYHYWNE